MNGIFRYGLVLLVLLVLIEFVVILALNKHNISLKSNLEYYSSTYLRKHGGTLLPGSKKGEFTNYDLRSIDGGRNWFAVKIEEDWSITILGEAEEVYPGLLTHLEGWDQLTAHVDEHGPITLTGDNVPDQIEMLEDAGFRVQEGQ